jgi:O-methyltransferase involved in polyketide biosynthesis
MSQLMPKLNGVPRTLIFTLKARAEEHQRSDALFRDPKAAEWMQFMPWEGDLEEWYSWNYQVGIAVRTKLIDDIVRRHAASHADSLVVELGAGLSSRYYRVGKNKTAWIELDLPEVIDIRNQLEIPTSQHKFLASSILDFTWLDRIPAIPSQNILFIAEGLFYYFEESEVQQTIQKLRSHFPDATLVLDVGGSMSKMGNSKKAAKVGAPMKWFVKNERDISELGLSLVKVWSMFQTYPDRWRYFSWFSRLPFLRNACLILETQIQSL